MTKIIIYTKGTVKIVENPSIVEKFQLTEESAIEGFYCTFNFKLLLDSYRKTVILRGLRWPLNVICEE